MYKLTHTHTHTHIMYTYTRTLTHVFICAYASLWLRWDHGIILQVNTCVCVFDYVCVYVWVCVFVYACSHVRVCLSVCVCVCMCLCVSACVCIYVCSCLSKRAACTLANPSIHNFICTHIHRLLLICIFVIFKSLSAPPTLDSFFFFKDRSAGCGRRQNS